MLVVIDSLITGTHTGTPFSFGPFDPVPAKGTVLKLDPERCAYKIRRKTGILPDEKEATGSDTTTESTDDPRHRLLQEWEIIEVKITSLGKTSSAAAMYEQCGGVLF